MKLVRDKYNDPDTSRMPLSKHELKILLRAKLVEESTEVLTAITKADIIEEIGDVLDVIDAICYHFKIDPKTLEEVRKEKIERKGSFINAKVKVLN
jgi:predicted house-cleaning noncanonical NTP pyrophosphatase (MazG superfamily)